MTRIVIAGHPGGGKTTMAGKLGLVTHHTDDLMDDYQFEDAKYEIVRWLNSDGPWCIEGVQAGRGLRQWMRDNPTGKPCDKVIYLQARTPLSGVRLRMAKGCDTVFNGIRHAMADRGVVIERPNGHMQAARWRE